MSKAILGMSPIGAITLMTPAVADQPEDPVGRAKQIIDHFQMTQVMHEGPWFSIGYVSPDKFSGDQLPERYGGRAHAWTTSILGVATRRDFSAFHRIQTDETWHFYGGDPVDMLLLYPDGHGEKICPGSDVLHGERVQFTVPRGVWQGSIPAGEHESNRAKTHDS